MTEKRIDLTRRKLLAAAGTVGVAGAGAGLGTSALYSDTESFEDNELVAGELDLLVDWQQLYEGPNGLEYVNAHPDHDGDGIQSIPGASYTDEGRNIVDQLSCSNLGADYSFGGQDSLVELSDVKPGDRGEITFSLHLCDSPGYVWLTGSEFESRENGQTEPEADAEGPADIRLDNGRVQVTFGEVDSGSSGDIGSPNEDWYFSFDASSTDVDPGSSSSVDILYEEFWFLYGEVGGTEYVLRSDEDYDSITTYPSTPGNAGTWYTADIEFTMGGVPLTVTREVKLDASDGLVNVSYEVTNDGSTGVSNLRLAQYVDYDVGGAGGEYARYTEDTSQGLEYIWQLQEDAVDPSDSTLTDGSGDTLTDLYVGFTGNEFSVNHNMTGWPGSISVAENDGTWNNDSDRYPDSGSDDVDVAMQWDLADTLAAGATTSFTNGFVMAPTEAEFRQLLGVAGPNDPPTADAGPDQTATAGDGITLSGSGTDPEGDSLSYSWTQTGGPSVTLQDAGTQTPDFTAPAVSTTETLTFELTVTDTSDNTATDAVDVTVEPGATTPAPPTPTPSPEDGELEDHTMIRIWYDDDCDNEHDDGEQLVFGPGIGGYTDYGGENPATLAAAVALLTEGEGRIPLDGDGDMGWDEAATGADRDPLPAESPVCLGVEWWIPAGVGNEIQTDSVALDLGFYTQQARHSNGAASD